MKWLFGIFRNFPGYIADKKCRISISKCDYPYELKQSQRVPRGLNIKNLLKLKLMKIVKYYHSLIEPFIFWNDKFLIQIMKRYLNRCDIDIN